MLKEFGAIVKVLDKLKAVLEDSKLKEKWEKEKVIKGRLILEGYQIDFILKEAEKDGQSGKRNEGYNGYLDRR